MKTSSMKHGKRVFDNIGDHSKSAFSNEDDEKDSDSDLEIIPTLKTCPKVIQTLEDACGSFL